MSKFNEYMEMAYRGGESYSGRSLLSESAVGRWIYQSGIRNRDVFSFNHQRTRLSKKLPEGRLVLWANVSKADPTLKSRLIKTLNEADPTILENMGTKENGWTVEYGYLRLKWGLWDEDDIKKKKIDRQVKQIKDILTAGGFNYEYDNDYSFTFPSQISFNKAELWWGPGDESIQSIKSPKKVYGDDEYAKLLSQVYSAKTVADLPLSIKSQISGIKRIK